MISEEKNQQDFCFLAGDRGGRDRDASHERERKRQKAEASEGPADKPAHDDGPKPGVILEVRVQGLF
jgi:hypothetical protein